MKKFKFELSGLKIIFFLTIFFLAALGLAQEEAPPNSKPETINNLITLDFKDVDLKDALKIVTQASGFNIVMDNDVKATVTITLKDVTWQTALDNILKTNGLTYRFDGNIIRITTLETVKKEEDTLPLTTKIIRLNFAKVQDLQTSFSKIISTRGNIQTNINTNSLIITDTPAALDKLEGLARSLDVRTPQVMIEALIVSVKLTDSGRYGLDFTSVNKKSDQKGLNRKITQTLKASNSIMDLYYGKTILPNFNLTAQLNFFAEDKRVKILANPRVLTLDNLPAHIEIIEQVPYTQTTQSTSGSGSASALSSVEFKEAGIKLDVTPHITKDKFVSLSVKAEQSFVAAFVGPASDQPEIDSRKVDTNFMLKNGESIVIGGLRKKDNTTTIDKVPILGDIPFVGRLFKREVKDIINTELVIFITPRIIEESLMTVSEEDKLEKSADELNEKLSLKERLALRERAIAETLNKLAFSSLKEIK